MDYDIFIMYHLILCDTIVIVESPDICAYYRSSIHPSFRGASTDYMALYKCTLYDSRSVNWYQCYVASGNIVYHGEEEG